MKMRAALVGTLRRLRDCGRLMVGVPSYEDYLHHVCANHADSTPMSEVEFIRNRQAARFGEGGRGGFRCC